ncbi:MAG: hypothetical protein ACI4AA_11540 [Lachnospiraceae bacterium]
MYSYSLQQWLLFFFIYCFLGWCWESVYVSVKKRRWVNRGFLNGPFLPIYGFGALAVLVATLPVREWPVLVYIFGLLGATLLELVTGICMESLFHVRYWDYSNQKFNFKGHICLGSSIAWGFFSLAMIYGFHKPIERLVLELPYWLSNAAAFALTAIVASDFAVSFKTAMELRDILDSIERMKADMKRLQRRAEIIETFLADSAEKKNEEFIEKKEELLGRKDEFKEELQEFKNEFKAGLRGRKEDIVEELRDIREKQQVYRDRMKNGTRRNISVENLLKRNPTAASKKYSAALKEYKEQFINAVKEEIEERKKR